MLGENNDIVLNNQIHLLEGRLSELRPSSLSESMDTIKFITDNNLSQKKIAELSKIKYTRLRNLINNPKTKVSVLEETALKNAIVDYISDLTNNLMSEFKDVVNQKE